MSARMAAVSLANATIVPWPCRGKWVILCIHCPSIAHSSGSSSASSLRNELGATECLAFRTLDFEEKPPPGVSLKILL